MFKKVKNTRVIPVTGKIVLVFIIFILLSNFATNYFNLTFNRNVQLDLMRQLLAKDLNEMYAYCNNQFEIFQFDKNEKGSIDNIEKKGKHELKNVKAVFLGITPDGRIQFHSGKDTPKHELFTDKKGLASLKDSMGKNGGEGHLYFDYNGQDYYGVYKYNSKWNFYIVRAEELNDFYKESRKIFIQVSLIILIITIASTVIGVYVLRYILRFIQTITKAIMNMIASQQLTLVDMKGATNDDVSYLGVAFNSLSSTVNNLVQIFQKFANQDIVSKAYREREVKLEGARRELAILFTDIKSFTFITETLGTDIIKLLNLHYDRAIREIIKYDGVIGSIIGDALLAVYGALDDSKQNKSYQAVLSGYKLHEVTKSLRDRMSKVRDKLQKEKGKLSPDEERIYKAVLLEIGVGIDGGEVFYGTLGSYVRMTNTVIGDNVNAASRLEGLTRVYKLPIICSEYIKNDVETNVKDHGIRFVEIDTVQVKGKTTGRKVYWPLVEKDIDKNLKKEITYFETGLKLYYMGDWQLAKKHFDKCKHPVAEVFKERTTGKCPKKWNGIWEMTTK